MGDLVGEASGRTFKARSTYISAPRWSSLSLASFDCLKIPPSEALKSGLPNVRFSNHWVYAWGGRDFGRMMVKVLP
jgi:hypothetical protein